MELQEYYREHSLSGIDFSLKDREPLDSSRHHQFAKLNLFFILYFCMDGCMDFCLWFEKHLILKSLCDSFTEQIIFVKVVPKKQTALWHFYYKQWLVFSNCI